MSGIVGLGPGGDLPIERRDLFLQAAQCFDKR